MNSTDIKEMLDERISDELEEFYPYRNVDIEKAVGKWKRIKKFKNANGQWQRIFENTVLNFKFVVVEEEIIGIMPEGKYVFCMSDTSSNFVVSDYDYFKNKGFLSDWGLGGWLVFPDFVAEKQEGIFKSTKNSAETRNALIALGFVEDDNFSAFAKKYPI